MSSERSVRGARARRSGRRSEWLCALWLMAKGYRLLGFRLRTGGGEIDLLAVRRGVVAVVEVKRRRTLAEALDAVSWAQRRRLVSAARSISARRREFANAPVRLDLIALAPGRLPRHIRDAWRDQD
ncbi:MAG TPA: YraN family protein [Caulobacteraceae bacterium]|nr:YraN family protein [Caulobacteraceae bacterium]